MVLPCERVGVGGEKMVIRSEISDYGKIQISQGTWHVQTLEGGQWTEQNGF